LRCTGILARSFIKHQVGHPAIFPVNGLNGLIRFTGRSACSQVIKITRPLNKE